MGAFDVIPNITVPDPDDPEAASRFRRKWKWEAHEQVIMRGVLTAGDQEVISNAATATDRRGGVSYHAGSGRAKLLECMIVDWTLSSGGHRVEVTPATIKRLPTNYSIPLLQICDEMATAMSEEEQEDFFGGANGHSEASSSAMRKSLKP